MGKLYIGGRHMFGSDPEFFFEKDGEIISSTQVIPPELQVAAMPGSRFGANILLGKITQDGIQAELHPRPHTCRATAASEFAATFSFLEHFLSKAQPGTRIRFDQAIEISEDNFAQIPDEAKALGCMPSFNIYEPSWAINVDALSFRLRSCGGHVHLSMKNAGLDVKKLAVKFLDALLGNTCVILDRHPLSARRREIYGRAGEYRLPDHGLEYRVLSNFWLRSYELMSMVIGIARGCIDLANAALTPRTVWQQSPQTPWDGYYVVEAADNEIADLLFKRLDEEDLRRAINENDADLAMRNYLIVEDYISQVVVSSEPTLNGGFPLAPHMAKDFRYFLETGTDAWFGRQPLRNWEMYQSNDPHGRGFESFLKNNVAAKRVKALGPTIKKDLINAMLNDNPAMRPQAGGG